MLQFLKKIDGAKTYLGCGAFCIAGLLWHFGVITTEQFVFAETMIGALTGVFMRKGAKKAEKKAAEAVLASTMMKAVMGRLVCSVATVAGVLDKKKASAVSNKKKKG